MYSIHDILECRLACCCWCCVCTGAASIGVIRVDNLAELQAAYQRVVKDLSRAKVRTAQEA